jgi:hypothetical protein
LLAEQWDGVVREADVVIVGKHLPGLDRLPDVLRENQTVIDLLGVDVKGDVLRPWADTSPAVHGPAGQKV